MSYYKTILYYNVYDTTKCVVLADQTQGIIEKREKLQGYVSKEDLLNSYSYRYCVNYDDIGENTYIIEYLTTSLGSVEKVETYRIKVK